MDTKQFWQPTFEPGERVIYVTVARRMGIATQAEWPAIYIRSQIVNDRQMHVIELDDRPGQPRQVGRNSIRPA
jgi:hypothetical protein